MGPQPPRCSTHAPQVVLSGRSTWVRLRAVDSLDKYASMPTPLSRMEAEEIILCNQRSRVMHLIPPGILSEQHEAPLALSGRPQALQADPPSGCNACA